MGPQLGPGCKEVLREGNRAGRGAFTEKNGTGQQSKNLKGGCYSKRKIVVVDDVGKLTGCRPQVHPCKRRCKKDTGEVAESPKVIQASGIVL